MTEKPELKEFEPLKTDFIYEFGRCINYSWFKLFHNVRYKAKGNIPKQGPIIFAPNHVSYYDPPIVAVGIPFRIRFMAWDALFKVPVLKQLMVAYGAYPVKLQAADKGAIAMTLKVLRHGEAVMIFPEGGRHEGPGLDPFEQGAARLAIQTNAAIVPVSVLGIQEAWPMSRALPRLFKPAIIKFHKPIYPSELSPDLDMKAKVTEMNNKIRYVLLRRLRAWEKLKYNRIQTQLPDVD